MHIQGELNQLNNAGLSIAGRWLLPVFFWLCLLLPGLLTADSERGSFTVTGVETRRGEDAWRVNANLNIRLSEGAREALDNGVPLVLQLQVQALERQPWLWDKVIAEGKRSYQLQYHALSRTYLVKNLNTGFQRSFRHLEDALQDAGVMEDVKVVEFGEMKDGRRYTVRLRGRLDIEALPTPVRLLAYVSSAWDMDNEWYKWRLAP